MDHKVWNVPADTVPWILIPERWRPANDPGPWCLRATLGTGLCIQKSVFGLQAMAWMRGKCSMHCVAGAWMVDSEVRIADGEPWKNSLRAGGPRQARLFHRSACLAKLICLQLGRVFHGAI